MAEGNGIWKPATQLGALGVLMGLIFGLGWLIDRWAPAIVGRLERTADAIEAVAATSQDAKAEIKLQTELLTSIATGQQQVLDIITTDPEEREVVRRRIRREREP